MNMPNSLPPSFTQAGSVTQRFGTIARDAAPTLGAYMNIVRARKWLVLAVTFLITVIAAVAVSLMTPVYRATTVLLIENSTKGVVSFEELYGVPAGSREFFQTQAEFMKSREVAQRVVTSMKLAGNPHFDPRQVPPSRIGELLSDYPALSGWLGIGRPPRQFTEDQAEQLTLSRFRSNLDVVPVRMSQLVEIRFESPDPFLAAQIANQTAEAYVTADLDARFNQQQTASRWLNDRLEQLRLELEKSEQGLQSYREEIGLIATPNSSMGGNVRQLDTSAERLITARVERAQAEQVYRQVAPGARNRYEVPAVFNNPAVAVARAALVAGEKRLADVAGNLGPAHPEYKAAQTELAQAQENVRRQSEGVIASLAKQYEVARSTERALEQALASSRGDIQEINRKEGRLNVLERVVNTNQQVYQTFLARVKETDATSDFRNPIARVVDQAVPPLVAVKPPKAQVVLLAAVLGAVVAALLAIALEQKTAVIRSSDEVLEKLGAPLLVAVPKVAAKQAGSLHRQQFDEPQSLFSEAIRSASTGVRLSTMDTTKPVIAITSSLPNEGKSTVALNYAIEQARTKRTLLIDADMRKPSLHTMLGVPADTKGLTELFAGEAAEDCIQVAGELKLSLIFCGVRSHKAHDLLMSPRFAEIIQDLKTRFDVIIIDTPPLELVSDALPIGLQATGIIYIIKAGETLIPLVRRGLNRIEDANIRLLGVILNSHDFERANRYYGEYSAYGTYKKGYYGASS